MSQRHFAIGYSATMLCDKYAEHGKHEDYEAKGKLCMKAEYALPFLNIVVRIYEALPDSLSQSLVRGRRAFKSSTVHQSSNACVIISFSDSCCFERLIRYAQ